MAENEECPICQIETPDLHKHGIEKHNVDFDYILADHLGNDFNTPEIVSG